MNRKNFQILWTLILLAISSNICWAQEYEAPNYQLIKKQISNSKSAQYYPKLMERYLECDTMLTNEDYRLLYYGFTMREDYVPYQEKSQQFFDIRRQVTRNQADQKILNEAMSITETILEDSPFDLSAISLRSIAALQLGDSLQYEQNKAKYSGLLEAITSSGDGETAQSAFHIADVEHEYEITAHLGLVVKGNNLINEKVEYLIVETPNADNIEGIYFNYDACGSQYKKKYE